MSVEDFRRTLVSGVTVVGPAPTGRVHVPLDGGILALYGQNGAGKSRVLRGVGAALRGEAVDGTVAYVHLRVPEVDDELDDPFLDHLLERCRSHAGEESGRALAAIRTQLDDETSGVSEETGRGLDRLGDFIADFGDTDYSPWSIRELVRHHVIAREFATGDDFLPGHPELEEMAGTGNLCLVPTGSADHGAWDVYGALGSDSEAAAGVLGLDRGRWRRVAALMDAARAEGREPTEDELAVATQARAIPWRRLSSEAAGFLEADAVQLLHEDVPWPQWATQPVVKMGTVDMAPLVVVDDDSAREVDEVTRAVLTELPAVVEMYEETTSVLSAAAEQFLGQVGRSASDLLTEVLPGAPLLRFEVGDPHDWLRGHLPLWRACLPGEVTVDLDELSHAQGRWARIAILVALSQHRGLAPAVVLLDEPEAGLHRSAEAHLPAALTRIIGDDAAAVVVATHSPVMLDKLLVQPVRVHRGLSGLIRASPLSVAVRTDLDREVTTLELGVRPSDLLQLVRVAMVVEGAHDEVVLTSMLGFGDDPRMLVLPVGGAKQFPSLATAQVLWQFTDATVVVVVDGIQRDRLQPVWERVRAATETGDRARARREVQALDRLGGGGEIRWLRDLMGKMIDSGDTSRMVFEPLSEPDIVCYLPQERVLGNRTWDEVVTAWRRAAAPDQARDLKKFLRDRYEVSVSVKNIRGWASGAPVPRELLDLGLRVAELAAYGAAVPPRNRPEAGMTGTPGWSGRR